MRVKLCIYSFLLVSFLTGCQHENGVPRMIAKKPIESIPMESVDLQTGGSKAGGTHFHISSDELFLDYTYFEDEATANANLENERANAKAVIEQGDVRGNRGTVTGTYWITEDHTRYEKDRFCLKWTNANRYTAVCSASRQALEEFRAAYDL